MRRFILLAVLVLLTGCATQLYWPQNTGNQVGAQSLANPEEWSLIRQRLKAATREVLGSQEDVEIIEKAVRSHLKSHVESKWPRRNPQLSMNPDIRWLSPDCIFVRSTVAGDSGYYGLWAEFFLIYEKQQGVWKFVILYTDFWVERVI